MGTVAEYKDCSGVESGVVGCVWVTVRDVDIIVLSRVGVHAPRFQENL